MPTKTVRIDSIELLDYAWPMLTLRIVCGRGTYIRSLGRDIGEALGTGGHLASLRRTAVGGYNLDVAHPIERFEAPIAQEDLLPVPE
jgi:tRNA pseudouridine55 synthase